MQRSEANSSSISARRPQSGTPSLSVPGLLQTAEHARRLIAMQAGLHAGGFGDLAEALASPPG